jgi:hypothetical protein
MNKWAVHITYFERSIYLGCFEIELDAKKAYEKALRELEQGLDLNILYPKWAKKSSKYKWVCFDKRSKTWTSRYKGKHIGCFKTEEEANEAVQNYIKQLNYDN